MNPERRVEWQIALWFVFLVFFIAAGSLPLRSITHQRMVRGEGPLNTIDAILHDEFGVNNAAAAIARSLKRVPASTPVTVIYPDSGRRALAGIVTAQLAWPHPTAEIAYRTTYGTDVDLERVRERGGVAFFLGTQAPSALGKVRSLRPAFHIVFLNTQS